MKPGERWTVDEFLLAIEEYYRTYALVMAGAPVSKRSVATELAECLARTKCAVEFVWSNISYLCRESGRDWMEGHPPRAHYSRVLAAVLADYWEENGI